MQNHVTLPTSLSGGPALQFGSVQKNLHSSYRIGLAPRHSSKLGFNFVFLLPGSLLLGV